MRKFLGFIITIILIVLIFVLCISFKLKKTVINTLSKSIVQKEISSNVVDFYKKNVPSATSKEIKIIENRILNNKQIVKITEKYFDSIIETIINDKEVEAPDINKELNKIIDDNKDIIKGNLGVTDEQVDLIEKYVVNQKTIDNLYKNVTKMVKNDLSDEEVKLINIYNFLIGSTFKYIVIGLIVFNIILLMIIQKSYYNWLFNLSISFAINGIVLSLLLSILNNYISSSFDGKFNNISIDINFNSLFNVGYLCFLACGVLAVFYIIISTIIKKNKIEN